MTERKMLLQHNAKRGTPQPFWGWLRASFKSPRSKNRKAINKLEKEMQLEWKKRSHMVIVCTGLYTWTHTKILLSATSSNLKVNDLNNNNNIYIVLYNIWNVSSFDIIMSSISSILRGCWVFTSWRSFSKNLVLLTQMKEITFPLYAQCGALSHATIHVLLVLGCV